MKKNYSVSKKDKKPEEIKSYNINYFEQLAWIDPYPEKANVKPDPQNSILEMEFNSLIYDESRYCKN